LISDINTLAMENTSSIFSQVEEAIY